MKKYESDRTNSEFVEELEDRVAVEVGLQSVAIDIGVKIGWLDCILSQVVKNVENLLGSTREQPGLIQGVLLAAKDVLKYILRPYKVNTTQNWKTQIPKIPIK